MPEIKNTFTKGKMNLDLDERLVPNGEYKEALNIQVSTSDDSDIGSAQNILGNTSLETIITGEDYQCVGSIGDEKNNKLYWFITNGTVSAIMEYNVDTTVSLPILVDLDNSVLEFDGGNQITGINVLDNFLFWTDGENEPKKINIENFRTNDHSDLTTNSDMYVNGDSVGAVKKEHITVIKKRPTQAPTMDLVYVGQDSSSSGVLNTAIDFSDYSVGSSVTIALTLNTFVVQSSGLGLALDYTDVSGAVTTAGVLSSDLYDALEYSFEEDDVLLLSDPTETGFLPNNAQVRMLITSTSTAVARTVISGSPDVFVQTIVVKILSIDSNTPAGDVIYDFQVEDLNDLLFNTSFPRFSYRYKYEDGEYSAFGPFTQVGFAAGEFSIHPTKEPYNSAMENKVKQIKLREFVTHDIPGGVVEIDLLYKPDNSTNVYSIDTVKPKLANGNDNKEWTLYDVIAGTEITGPTLPDGSTPTASSTGCYIVKTENIYASLPSNQLLRPWDNVPKKAQAQDFTANRLIYGNYTQNLKLSNYNNKLTLRSEERAFGDQVVDFEKGQPSIKSQRTYQSGIVFGDEYGRETPVFTGGKNGSTKITYDRTINSITFTGNASKSNRFYFKNLTNIAGKANWATQENEPYYFKVFLKETASEYYNLVMDRVYRAEEDSNLWISFPSSDRNKLQEDDYIILKKALESNNQVEIENKFKVIDIKNEAPDFIRKKYQQLGQADGNGTLSELYSNGAVQPFGGSSKIILSKESLIEENINDLQGIFDNGEKLSIKFSVSNSSNSKNSKRYNIISLTTEGSNPELYSITFDKAIVNQDSWVETSDGVLDPALKTSIWKETKQEWEEFQGRFFVKIISDITTDQYLETQIGVTIDTSLVARTSLFYLGDTNLLAYSNGAISQKQNTFNNTTKPLSNTAGIWNDNLKFDKAIATSGWFIDSAYTAAQQPTVLTDTSTVGTGATPWGWNANNSVPNNFAGINDVSVSGNLFKQGGKFGGAVDGLEGIITSSATTSDITSGARMWKRQVDQGSSLVENVYGPDGSSGNFFMHLSFSGVGVDLHDGTGLTNAAGLTNIQSNAAVPSTIYLKSIHNYNQQNDLWPSSDGDQQTLNIASSSAGMDAIAAERQWDPTYQHPENINIVSNLVRGSKFQFNNDANNTVFTIKNATIKHLYNHTGWNRVNELDSSGNNTVERENTVNYLWQVFKNNVTTANWNNLQDAVKDFGSKSNRRVCYILELDKNPIDECSINPEDLDLGVSTFLNFQQNYVSENSTLLSDNPAVWETESKDTSDLDIYYEASNAIPIRLDSNADSSNTNGYNAPDNRKGHMIAPIGSAVRCSKSGSHTSTPGYKDCVVESWDGNIVTINPGVNVDVTGGYSGGSTADQTSAFSSSTLKFYKDDLSYVEVGIFNVPTGGITSALITKFTLDRTINEKIGLPYFNCFSFGNGVESNRIRDDFNKPFISNGVKASSTLQEQYLEDHRSSGLIYSGLYSKNSSLNSLNQFIMAEKITKDLLPTYGSIQKLFARDSDLIALCEDKIVQIFADKDALFNADGNTQLVSTNNVLGQSRPFVGEYGISKNPESFASSSYRAYFADKQRGAVLRLSMDGLTPISNAGMSDWFRDKLKGGYFDDKIIGSYDSNKDNYNLTFDTGADFNASVNFKDIASSVTVTYKEDVKGWVSFKSFIPESGLSAVNTYFTFREGKIYSHNNETRNTFYGNTTDSFVTAIFNESPTTIKHFNTLNYDGLEGWNCDNITTDSEVSTVNGFVNKENKYFATIVGDDTADDLSSFNFQGIGTASSIETL
tara:strand:+ start:1564 stop:6957 length:5394 start_codon:yes stop_codon:yes gene_type:complete